MADSFKHVIGTRFHLAHIQDSFTGSDAIYVVNENEIVIASVELFNRKHMAEYWDCALVIADALENFAEEPYQLRARSNRA